MKVDKKINTNISVFIPARFEEIEEGSPPSEIQVLPVGKWEHDLYGTIVITPEDIRQFKENFDAQIRNGVRVTAGHDVMEEKPAIGWFTALDDRGEDGLWASVEWTPQGKDLLRTKSFKYFSPEFFSLYEDPQTHEKTENVLTGGALTNSPYFKELRPVVFHEPIKNFNENTMNIKDILNKEVSELTDEEKNFLAEHADQLTDEQKQTYEINQENGDGDDNNDADDGDTAEEDETGTGAEEAKAENKEAEPVAASEPKSEVMISASELKALREAANSGKQAYDELKTMRVTNDMNGMLFSSKNTEGRFLPKSKDKLKTFMESLGAEQYSAFKALVAELPKKELFSELGDGGQEDTSVQARIDKAVEAKMSEDKALSYGDALTQVFAEDKALEKEYMSE